MKRLLRLRLPALLLILSASVPSGAQVYDCGEASGKKAFQAALDETKANMPARYRSLLALLLESPKGDKRMCNVYDWCFGQGAKVKWAPPVTEDGAGLAGVVSASAAPCPVPWRTACRDQKCELRAALDAGTAVFERAADGKAILGGKAPTFATASKATTGDFPGVAFDWNGTSYKVQFKTLYVFRLNAAGGGAVTYADSGATMGADLLTEICSADGLPCDQFDGAPCRDIGLAPKGKAWSDIRGKLWTSKPKPAGCQPK